MLNGINIFLFFFIQSLSFASQRLIFFGVYLWKHEKWILIKFRFKFLLPPIINCLITLTRMCLKLTSIRWLENNTFFSFTISAFYNIICLAAMPSTGADYCLIYFPFASSCLSATAETLEVWNLLVGGKICNFLCCCCNFTLLTFSVNFND